MSAFVGIKFKRKKTTEIVSKCSKCGSLSSTFPIDTLNLNAILWLKAPDCKEALNQSQKFKWVLKSKSLILNSN
jgi:hypothetical protein